MKIIGLILATVGGFGVVFNIFFPVLFLPYSRVSMERLFVCGGVCVLGLALRHFGGKREKNRFS